MTEATPRMPHSLFAPSLAGATSRDRVVSGIGGMIAIAAIALLCHRFMPLPPGVPYLAAPLGASAVLVFALPASPLSQPWPVIGGNVVAALIGTLCARLIPVPEVAAGVAIGASIIGMSLLRCLHAPGGGTALVTSLAPPAVAASGYAFALAPIAVNSVLMVCAAFLFHRVSRHSYPHRPSAKLAAVTPSGLHRDDIARALAEMGDVFDIGHEDLDLLLTRAEYHAEARTRA